MPKGATGVCAVTGKWTYRSMAKAKRSLVEVRSKRRSECRAYFCGFCSGVHLTSQPFERRPA